MATNFLRRNKTVFTNPISSKTIYPFVIDKKMFFGKNDYGENYIQLGRIIRPINQNVTFDAELVFQCLIPEQEGNELFFKTRCELYLDDTSSGIFTDVNFSLISGFNGIYRQNINFIDTGSNNQIRISTSAINKYTFSNSSFANYINLIYLEKKEE